MFNVLANVEKMCTQKKSFHWNEEDKKNEPEIFVPIHAGKLTMIKKAFGRVRDTASNKKNG